MVSLSVVLSTYNRGHLLDRSLYCYVKQRLTVPFELIIIDDGSTDDTFEIVNAWAPFLDIKYIRLWKPRGLWRDCAATLNIGLRTAKGKLIVGTHPEVMPGADTLQQMWDAKQERTYLAAKIYYLTPEDQRQIDSVPWRERADTVLEVRNIPGFYQGPSTEVRGNPEYTHEATDRHTNWESFVFGGMTRETWQWFGGFSESDVWGAIDVDFLNRRALLGISTITLMDPTTICVHQNHDVISRATDVPTPRDLTKTMASLPRYSRSEDARLNHL